MEVAIHKLATQYRLPAHALSQGRRLDQLRSRAVDDAFRAAIHRAGIDEEAELCIRNLFVPVRLRLDTTDEALVANWSAALYEEICSVLRHGPTTNIVVYHSRRQALVDMALGVARGDVRRAWAWRQLGLWRTSHAVSDAAAVNELVSALQRTPSMVVPTLSALSCLGRLHSVSARFSAEHWEELGRAVLYEVCGADLPEVIESLPTARVVSEARQVLTKSRLLGAVTFAALRGMNVNARRAIAVLAIMFVDPGLLRRNTAGTLINLIAEAISSPKGEVETEFDEPDLGGTPELKSAAPAASHADAAGLVHDASSPLQRPSSDQVFPPALSRREKAQTLEPSGKPSHKSVADQSWFKQFPDEQTEPVDLRRRAVSRFAGLLLLIVVIQELDLPEQIAADEFLGSRSLAWALHHLALLLAPIEARDPAALAFAGLSPEAEWPWEDEASLSEAETEALSALADQIVTRLALLFDEDETRDISALEFVTRRRGEIVADPGRIEVRFPLDDVSTEIRRAGLDLNPGYVPWLGLVVMFVYE